MGLLSTAEFFSGGYGRSLLPYWRFVILGCIFAGGIHVGFIVHGAVHLLTPYPFKNASFILDLGMFCFLLQLLAVIGLNVGTPLRSPTPVQVASCLFPFLAVLSAVDATLPIFKKGYSAVVYSKESDILAKLAVAASLGFLSGISFWVDWALRSSEGLAQWGSMGQRDRTFITVPQLRLNRARSADVRRSSDASVHCLDVSSATRLHSHRRRSERAAALASA